MTFGDPFSHINMQTREDSLPGAELWWEGWQAEGSPALREHPWGRPPCSLKWHWILSHQKIPVGRSLIHYRSHRQGIPVILLTWSMAPWVPAAELCPKHPKETCLSDVLSHTRGFPTSLCLHLSPFEALNQAGGWELSVYISPLNHTRLAFHKARCKKDVSHLFGHPLAFPFAFLEQPRYLIVSSGGGVHPRCLWDT